MRILRRDDYCKQLDCSKFYFKPIKTMNFCEAFLSFGQEDEYYDLTGNYTFAVHNSKLQEIEKEKYTYYFSKNSFCKLMNSNSCLLGKKYTISTMMQSPMKNTGTWRTLTRGEFGDHQVLINASGQLGCYDNIYGTQFHDCGFNIDTLSPGIHHLCAVAEDNNTTFYIDGEIVGISDFQSLGEIKTIGNNHGRGVLLVFINISM
jgi:hypothetical protein